MADKTLRFILLGDDKTASKAIKGVGDEAGKAGGKLQRFGGAGKVAAAAVVAGLVAAGAAIVKFGADSVTAYLEAETSQRKLTDAYRRFPALADVSISSLRKLNAELQRKTGADGDALAAGQATLAQYKLTGSQIQTLTPLLNDYATKTGKSLPEAAKTLGKAMLGNGRALKDVGINFKDAGSTGKNFEQVVKGLRTQVGGFAAGEAKTLEGRTKILKEQFGDLQEEVGAALVPALEQLVDAGVAVMDWMAKNPGVAKGIAAGFKSIGTVATGLAKVLGPVLGPILSALIRSFSGTMRAVAGLLAAIGTIPGMEWAKKAAKELNTAADGADALAKGIDEIGKKKPKVVVSVEAKAAESALVKLVGKKRAAKIIADADTKKGAAELTKLVGKKRAAAIIASLNSGSKSKTEKELAYLARTRTAWIKTKVSGAGGGGGGGGSFAEGGPVRLAPGGRVPGWSPNDKADNVPAMLTAGEFVQPVDVVRHYGLAAMEALRNRRIPRQFFQSMGLANGGQAGSSSPARAAMAGVDVGSLREALSGMSIEIVDRGDVMSERVAARLRLALERR